MPPVLLNLYKVDLTSVVFEMFGHTLQAILMCKLRSIDFLQDFSDKNMN